MEQTRNTFRYLIKVAGKILFVTGLLLNILMVFFGFWPSLIYVLIMLVGAIMFSLNKYCKVKLPSLPSLGDGLKKLPHINVAKPDLRAIGFLVKTAFIAFVALILIGLFGFWAAQDYFKKRDTFNDCREIVAALNDFYKQKNRYPDSLYAIICNNPMREGWTADHWGNTYHFNVSENGKSYLLISAGKDGKFNTKDDLTFTNN